MPKLLFKKKCRICNDKWVLDQPKQFTICTECHMKQIFSEEVTDKKYAFLNISHDLYQKSRFLRNIRQSYVRFHELSEKQVSAFKETVKSLKSEA